MKEVDTLCVVAFILFVAWAIETLRDSPIRRGRKICFGLALAAVWMIASAITWQAANARDLGLCEVSCSFFE
jgi:hypothetical protein